MECDKCGRYAPDDTETGYRGDGLCRECAEAEERRLEENGPEEPNDPDGPWGGGFAWNH